MIRHIPVVSCATCPYIQYHYGQHECSKMGFMALPKQKVENGINTAIPTWCPLPPHPSFKDQKMKHRHWYDNPNGGPKTHHMRTCSECRKRGYKIGCDLPFRRVVPVRKIAALSIKLEPRKMRRVYKY